MKYLDTNVLIYAIENHPRYGRVCKTILSDVEKGRSEVCASILILIELLNVLTKINKILKKEKKKPLNIRKNLDAVLSLPIIWYDVDLVLLKRAAEYDLDVSGVDYVHIATMEINMINEVISADKELDKVTLVKRIDPLKYQT